MVSSKNLRNIGTVAIIILLLAELTAFALPTLQNGDFSEELDPNLNWTVESGDVTCAAGSYFALFTEVLENQEPNGIIVKSALGQEFTFPTDAQTLSFNIVLRPQGYESDSFTASLFYSRTDPNTLISNGVGVDEFFYIDTGYLYDPNPNDPPPGSLVTVGTFDGQTVTLDVSGFQGQDAYLLFSLNPEIDGLQTFVELRNVNISVIPEPDALVLGSIGLGYVTWLRKRRKL